MKVIRKNVGAPVEVIDVDNAGSLEFWQATVGGYVQMVPIGPEVDVVCNEEGMFSGPDGGPLPQNAAGFLGNILILAVDSDSGDARDLTEEETRKALTYLAVLHAVKHPMHAGESVTGLIFDREKVDAFLKAQAEGTLAVWDAM